MSISIRFASWKVFALNLNEKFSNLIKHFFCSDKNYAEVCFKTNAKVSIA